MNKRLKNKLAIVLALSLTAGMIHSPVTDAAKKVPSFSVTKKTLEAGTSFNLKVKKNKASKIIGTSWSVNLVGQRAISMTESGKTYALITANSLSGVAKAQARVTAKVKYKVGKKKKTKKLTCVITVLDPNASASTPTPAITTPTPEVIIFTPTPSVSPSASPTPTPAGEFLVDQGKSTVSIDNDYNTIVTVYFNQKYDNVTSYDATPTPTVPASADTGYWTTNVSKVARFYDSSNKEQKIERITRPNENNSPDSLQINLGVYRPKGTYHIDLTGFRAYGSRETNPVSHTATITTNTTALTIDTNSSSYQTYTGANAVNGSILLTLKGWNATLKSTSEFQSLISALTRGHITIVDSNGNAYSIQDISSNTTDNSLLLVVSVSGNSNSGTAIEYFRVSFDEYVPYMLFKAPSQGLLTAENGFTINRYAS